MPSLFPLAAVLAAAAAALPPPPVRIVLEFDARLPAPITHLALQETAAIWRPYGVAILGADASRACLPVECAIDARLPVRIDDDEAIGSGAELVPLAGIRFRRDGLPEGVIRLRYRALTTVGLGSVLVGDLRESQWPRTLRNLVLARIVGRVVAHEIGHWLLQKRDHAPAGLMRAVQKTQELAEPRRSSYVLMPAEIARLREIVARHFSR